MKGLYEEHPPHVPPHRTGAICFALPAHAQTKVGVVNAAKVFQEIQETKDLQAKLEIDRKTFLAEDQKRQDELKVMKSGRDALKTDAPGYEDKNKELMTKAIEYQTWNQIQQATFAQTQKMKMISIFNKITANTAEVATAAGLDIVIAEQNAQLPDNVDQANVDQVKQMINQRNVFFTSATADISDKVIAAMGSEV